MTRQDRAEVVLSAEQLQVGSEWVVSGELRFRKRIVTGTYTVEVTLQREELVVESRDAVATNPDKQTWAGVRRDGAASSPPVARVPLVLVLREQVPDVRVVTRPYEQVTVHSVLVTDEVAVQVALRHEDAVVETTTPTGTSS